MLFSCLYSANLLSCVWQCWVTTGPEALPQIGSEHDRLDMFPVPTTNPQYITTWLPHYFSAWGIQQQTSKDKSWGGWEKYLLVSPSIWLFKHLLVFAIYIVGIHQCWQTPCVPVCVLVCRDQLGLALNTFQCLPFGWNSSVSKPHVCLCVVPVCRNLQYYLFCCLVGITLLAGLS